MDFRTAAIVPVAGLSSRMGGFKPLLEIGGETLIQRTVRSALAGGVQEVRVVLGREAQRVRAVLADFPKVVFVENSRYASTDMLHSVQLAMEKQEVDALFILPGDMPAIAPRTFELLAEQAADADNPPLLRPLHCGRHGHPLLVRSEAFAAISVYDSRRGGGLKAALADFVMADIEVADSGVLLDADTPDDLEKLKRYVDQDKRASHLLTIEWRSEADVDQGALSTTRTGT